MKCQFVRICDELPSCTQPAEITIGANVEIRPDGGAPYCVPVSEVHVMKVSEESFILSNKNKPPLCVVHFDDLTVASKFKETLNLNRLSSGHLADMDKSTQTTYFHYYSKLSNQMNMLQDCVRTSHYQKAVQDNPGDFEGMVVLDVGAGSGILSFFAAAAGAKRVYAVEASNVARVIEILKIGNGFADRITVINKTIETVTLDDLGGQKVDTLISEPIGTFLFNERMVESYLYARDHFLKPGGGMYPSNLSLSLAPFSDPALFNEMTNAGAPWYNQNFYGINLEAAAAEAVAEKFRQPVIDYIDQSCLLSPAHVEHFDLKQIQTSALENMTFAYSFTLTNTALIHGIASWFDVTFGGKNASVGFSTAPWCSPTHWYQIRFMHLEPLAVNQGQRVSGSMRMEGTNQQSYKIDLWMKIEDTNYQTSSAGIDLKDPEYRYFNYSQPHSLIADRN